MYNDTCGRSHLFFWNQKMGVSRNHCLVQWYRDGTDNIIEHSDKPP